MKTDIKQMDGRTNIRICHVEFFLLEALGDFTIDGIVNKENIKVCLYMRLTLFWGSHMFVLKM